MNYAGLLLNVVTSRHKYIVRRDQIFELWLIASENDLTRTDERGKPVSSCELAPLLDPDDMPTRKRRHALVVPTRRRSIALLVDEVTDAYTVDEDYILPMPDLFKKRLKRPWCIGVVIQDDIPYLVLDLRMIAQDVLLEKKDKRSDGG